MAHKLPGSLQQVGGITQRCALKKTHVYVRTEYIDVTEGCISQTRYRTTVMQKFPDFVSAVPHHIKPILCHVTQFTCMVFHPPIDGGIAL